MGKEATDVPNCYICNRTNVNQHHNLWHVVTSSAAPNLHACNLFHRDWMNWKILLVHGGLAWEQKNMIWFCCHHRSIRLEELSSAWLNVISLVTMEIDVIILYAPFATTSKSFPLYPKVDSVSQKGLSFCLEVSCSNLLSVRLCLVLWGLYCTQRRNQSIVFFHNTAFTQ